MRDRQSGLFSHYLFELPMVVAALPLGIQTSRLTNHRCIMALHTQPAAQVITAGFALIGLALLRSSILRNI
ncbi:hypothetical protein [Dictyobacter formicarum]|uniref:Uncharacterized protein n=1 Tax=Dictyobacter formicarum TaxID=2778368 RepID=A0ABQ3VFV0_9CHLR|nr:hypothetical protein [Dictyobacter formicarum]GHO84001.1 hypothetical protein KSZ_20070 [Dictyobacter formicarum]